MVEYVSVALVLTFVTTVLGISTFYKTTKKDTKADTLEAIYQLDPIKENLMKCNMKLDQICTVTNETRADIKAMDFKIQDIDKRTSILERDLCTAFTRIEELKTEVTHEHSA